VRTIPLYQAFPQPRPGQLRGLLRGSWAVLRRLGAAWADRRRTSASAWQLYLCSDRELRDMGLNRGDIPAVIRGTYRPSSEP
jgi:uncharacterized protein YjiS (DUF1127 family)